MDDGAGIHIQVQALDIIDTRGSCATFYAAFIRSWLDDSSFENPLRFASAVVSLKCTAVGPKVFPAEEA